MVAESPDFKTVGRNLSCCVAQIPAGAYLSNRGNFSRQRRFLASVDFLLKTCWGILSEVRDLFADRLVGSPSLHFLGSFIMGGGCFFRPLGVGRVVLPPSSPVLVSRGEKYVKKR